MFCPHCGQDLEDKARFCPRCGQLVQAAGKAVAPQIGQTSPAMERPSPDRMPYQPSYPYSSVDPAAVPPKKKKTWVVPVVIALVVLVLALIIVGVLLAITVYDYGFSMVQKDIITTSQVTPVPDLAGNIEELNVCLGITVDDFREMTGVVLMETDGIYSNLNGTVSVMVDEEGKIDTVILSEKDVGFSLFGVKVGMSRQQALEAASVQLFGGVESEDGMIYGENGPDELFSAYYDESTDLVDYIMYFTYSEEDFSGTNISPGSGLWYLGESLASVWADFGEDYVLDDRGYSVGFSYPDDGYYFSTNQTEYSGESMVTFVEMGEYAWFSDEIYIGMTYEELLWYMDLSEIYFDEFSQQYAADFVLQIDSWECYGAFYFESDGADAFSVGAFAKSDDLMAQYYPQAQ